MRGEGGAREIADRARKKTRDGIGESEASLSSPARMAPKKGAKKSPAKKPGAKKTIKKKSYTADANNDGCACESLKYYHARVNA